MKNPTLCLTHPEATQERLVAYAKDIPGAWVGLKAAALLLILEGQRPGWIIDVLGLTRQSLNQWMHGVNEQGLKALQLKPGRGRPTGLKEKIRKRLERDLEKSPLEFGLNRAHWDGPTLVVHLKRQLGITIKIRQAQRWMHQLGYTVKRGSYSYLQAGAKDAQKFRRALKKTS
jgi:transposase